MNEQQCRACLYFCQHYIPWYGDVYVPVEYGHCIYGRAKMCRAYRKACAHFLLRKQEGLPSDGKRQDF